MDSIIGKRAFGFQEFKPLRNVVYVERQKISKKVSTKSSQDSLFDSIFALDPITKLPTGDLSIYMSDNTSPEVREFVRTQLLRDMSSQNENISIDGLSDDDIVKYSRDIGESVSDYRSRLIQVLKDERKSDKSE